MSLCAYSKTLMHCPGVGLWNIRVATTQLEIKNKKGSVRCLSIVAYRSVSLWCRFCTWLAIFLAESFHSTSRIHDFLRAGIEGVAVRADFYMQQFTHCGLGFESITTTASNCNLIVLRMNVGFHFDFLKHEN